MATGSSPAQTVLAQTYRAERGKLIAFLARRFHDVELAEDAVQSATEVASRTWPVRGIPGSPAGWLLSVARRRCVDVVRRRERISGVLTESGVTASADGGELVTVDALEPGAAYIPDERLRLIYTCCHPALEPDTRVALTLQLVVGMTSDQIGRAFLVAPATVAQRLVRSKRKIREARIPIEVPAPEELAARTASVRRILYLIFNEGYAPTSGDRVVARRLCDEAIALARLLVTLLKVHRLSNELPESLGLLALMLLHDSRREARVAEDGRIIPLLEQDRRLWDRSRIAEGRAVLQESGRVVAVGPYQIQAAIGLQHAEAVSASATDWPSIRRLYAILEELDPSPVVRLNRLIAQSFAESPAGVLAELRELTLHTQMVGYAPLSAAIGDAAERAGFLQEAHHAFETAVAHATNQAERAHLRRRAESVPSHGPPEGSQGPG